MQRVWMSLGIVLQSTIEFALPVVSSLRDLEESMVTQQRIIFRPSITTQPAYRWARALD